MSRIAIWVNWIIRDIIYTDDGGNVGGALDAIFP